MITEKVLVSLNIRLMFIQFVLMSSGLSKVWQIQKVAAIQSNFINNNFIAN